MVIAAIVRLVLLTATLALGQSPKPDLAGPTAYTTGPEKTTLPGEPVIAPMFRWGHSPAVRVEVNGLSRFRFAIDTAGQGLARADTSLVENLGLEIVGQVRASDGTGRGSRPMDLVAIDSISLGGATFTGIEAGARDYNNRPDIAKRIDGILGVHLFHDCLLTLDFPGKRVIVEDGALPAPDGTMILPLSPDSVVPSIDLEIGDETLQAHIDSGSAGGLTLPARFAKTLELKSEPVEVGRARTVSGEYVIREATLAGSVFIGRHELREPRVTFIDGFETANIGNQILEHFALTLDLRSERVRFAREASGPLVSQPRYRIGVMFAPDQGGLRVADLVAGGAGEVAGLRKEDLIVALDGTRVAEIERQRLRTMFSSPEPIEVTIERGGETLRVTLTPVRVGM